MSVLGIIALDFHSPTAARDFEVDTIPFVRIAGSRIDHPPSPFFT
ncbi:MAG: hypothetical protein R3A45_10330 [Bdellovibrionota bacterium]